MSFNVTRLVWDRYPGRGPRLIVMLALADMCDDAGGSLWPSKAYLSKKTGIPARHIVTYLSELLSEKVLIRTITSPGGRAGETNQYRIAIARLEQLPPKVSTGDKIVTGDKKVTGDKIVTPRVTKLSREGRQNCHPNKPSIKPEKKPSPPLYQKAPWHDGAGRDWFPTASLVESVAARAICEEKFVVECGPAFAAHYADKKIENLDATFTKWVIRQQRYDRESKRAKK